MAIYMALARTCNLNSGHAVGMTYRSIAKWIGSSEPTVKRTIPLLLEQGLVERRTRPGYPNQFYLLEIGPLRTLRTEGAQSDLPSAKNHSNPDQFDTTYKETRLNKTEYKKNNSSPQAGSADARHHPIREKIIEFYKVRNQINSCPWDGSEGDALKRLLTAYPNLEVDEAFRCIRNFFDSAENTATRPRRWLPRLLEYSAGPIDERGKPLYVTGDQLRREAGASLGRF